MLFRSDVRYLQEAAHRASPRAPFDRILFTWAGVRALVRVEGVAEGAVSRKHALFDHAKRDGVNGVSRSSAERSRRTGRSPRRLSTESLASSA